MGRPREAAAILGWLASEHPELARVQLDYAMSLFVIGRDEEAGESFPGTVAQGGPAPGGAAERGAFS